LPDGDFGEKVYDQIRVIEPGRYRVFRKKEQIEEMYDVSDNSVTGNFEMGSADKDYQQVESGEFSLGEIPLVTIYSGKTENLVSKPPLLDIAYLNLAHFQRQADLIHSLHVASQPMLVMEGYDDQTKDLAISVNSMLAMVSMELEQKLQKCFNFSAEYVGIEPPEVKISRDFDIERLIGQDITALTALFDQQIIDREEFRDILVQGEVLPSANEAKSE
jgi:hypothetical protein